MGYLLLTYAKVGLLSMASVSFEIFLKYSASWKIDIAAIHLIWCEDNTSYTTPLLFKNLKSLHILRMFE